MTDTRLILQQAPGRDYSALPEHLRAEFEELDSAAQTAQETDAQSTATTPDPSVPTPDTSPATAPDADTVPQQTPDTPTTDNDLSAELARLQAQHSTLLGKYSAEVPRLNADLRQRDQKILELETELNRVKQAAVGDETESLVNGYGLDPEVVSMLTPEAIKALADKQKPAPATSAEQLQADARARFYTALDDPYTGIPNADAIFQSAEFKTWLNRFPQRASFLDAACDDLDAPSVISIFSEFLESRTPAPTPPVVPAPAPASSVNPAMAIHAQPPGAAAPPPTPQKPTYTRAQYDAALETLTRGVQTPAQETLLHELNSAFREGRIIG